MMFNSKEVLEFQNEIPEDSASELASDSRLLHIYFDDWLLKKAKVLDTDKTTVLYTVDMKCMKPNMKIHSSGSGSQIGAVNFHFLTSRIDTTIHSQEISLASQGCTKRAYSYNSPTFGHRDLTWKGRSKWSNPINMDLLDEKARPVARFHAVSWARKKAGKLELLGPSVEAGPMMDEVVVTGLAVAQYRAQQMRATYGASAVVTVT